VSANPAKNTDGWDTYRSENIVIQNSVVDNGDDCVSFKPNSTDVVVQGLRCNGSHGVSVGSLGQYAGEVDIVRNVYVRWTFCFHSIMVYLGRLMTRTCQYGNAN
jgi:galacturan 1,4-alpha-galacturonidase